MMKATPANDIFLFARMRAAQLLDEGMEKNALKLLRQIDQAQIRLNKHSLKESQKVCNR